MKSTTFALATLLVSAAIAQPHHQHNAFHRRQHKRDETVVWVTDYVYTTEMVDVTTTIWVSAGYVPPTPSAASTTSAVAAQFFENPASSAKPTSSTAAPATVAPAAVVPVVEPAPVVSSSSSTPVAPAPAPTSSSVATGAPAAVDTPAVVAPAPVVVSSSSSSSVVASSPAETSSPVSTPSSSSGGSSDGGLTTGNCDGASEACGGDMTFYDTLYPAYGACGWQNDGTKEAVIALPFEFMGTQSNGNPFCGRMVTINYNGKSTTAKVVDKCMGCLERSIDLSHFAFDALADESIGRAHCEWYFND